jgi:hypothetical protein
MTNQMSIWKGERKEGQKSDSVTITVTGSDQFRRCVIESIAIVCEGDVDSFPDEDGNSVEITSTLDTDYIYGEMHMTSDDVDVTVSQRGEVNDEKN